ncbi:MAG: hypothetical protein IKA54_05790 [Clostridia bacterium]|nr:hypothetical protein [Clostridia bacterium]
MMVNKEIIKQILDGKDYLKDKLFNRGFVYSSKPFDSDAYPFYGMWQKEEISIDEKVAGVLYVSPNQNYYVKKCRNYTLALIGHAYNPFSGEYLESEILNNLEVNSKDDFLKVFNELTGVFSLLVITSDRVFVFGDAAGMQTTYYGVIGDVKIVTSHVNLASDLLGLTVSDYVKELSSYKFFKLLGNSLPGDLSPYDGLKRLIPNHCVEITENESSVHRYYTPCKKNLTTDEIVDGVSEILSANLSLIAKKWKTPAISMTGGCDSKTTLSCANEVYDKFNYFSYVSSDEEGVDARAAKKIIESLGLNHKTYEIPKNSDELSDFDDVAKILFWNTGALRKNNENDIRKRIYFSNVNDFDVEVKSWVSEVGRAYYTKRFNGRKKFGKITPRKLTTLYKFFFHNRKLVKKTDKVFEDYIKAYLCDLPSTAIDWQELFFWEFRMSSWNGNMITGEHRYSFDITIPYNNKHLLELLLNASLEERENDLIYKKIRNKMDKTIDENGISITNVKHTKNRALLEDIYYVLHSKFPF